MFPPFGPVVQLVRTPACHAGGRGFEPLPGRQFAFVAQLVEQWTENPCVTGSIPVEGTIMREWLSGRASPCQGERREFESRLPLQFQESNRIPFFLRKENFMQLPKDPAILLSYLNTKLRDTYKSLDDLCDDLESDKELLINKCGAIGYIYYEERNQFI